MTNDQKEIRRKLRTHEHAEKLGNRGYRPYAESHSIEGFGL